MRNFAIIVYVDKVNALKHIIVVLVKTLISRLHSFQLENRNLSNSKGIVSIYDQELTLYLWHPVSSA